MVLYVQWNCQALFKNNSALALEYPNSIDPQNFKTNVILRYLSPFPLSHRRWILVGSPPIKIYVRQTMHMATKSWRCSLQFDQFDEKKFISLKFELFLSKTCFDLNPPAKVFFRTHQGRDKERCHSLFVWISVTSIYFLKKSPIFRQNRQIL